MEYWEKRYLQVKAWFDTIIQERLKNHKRKIIITNLQCQQLQEPPYQYIEYPTWEKLQKT